ncbi:probable G-protein coupled receptor CG31760 [Zeugodacus cucurbitae]|uniref:probable G-protein coupled receptor CG31760 n=1 Tax=Zeugodacus cucurbitae TaxID=28588 RepID=UPI00059681B8|nr:probable G-protein coupled receptor CG31760 [Zeugodacus cucurbitae]
MSSKSVTSSMTISPESPSFNEAHLPHIPSSTTSTSSMYAIRTPSPIRFHLLESPSSELDAITITELVEVHCAPLKAHDGSANMSDLMVGEQSVVGVNIADDFPSQNNNTSCSMSSTLTDSKTVDVRTPIVV